MINISYIEFDKPLKDNMWYTAEPFYQNVDMNFNSLPDFIRSDKRQISPYFYKHRQKNKAGWDNSRQNLLIFDIDDGMSLDEVMDMLGGYSYLIYTTKSHQKEKQGKVCDRFRLIIPSDNIPKDEDVYFAMLMLMRHKLKSDEQTETKSAGFLCNADSYTYLNNGKMFDCSAYTSKAERIVALESKIKILEDEEREAKRQLKKELSEDVEYEIDAQELKESLDIHTVKDILDCLDIEIYGDMCKLREERSPSTKIYANGLYDFGTGTNYDIYDIVMDKTGLSFKDSIKYVQQFI